MAAPYVALAGRGKRTPLRCRRRATLAAAALRRAESATLAAGRCGESAVFVDSDIMLVVVLGLLGGVSLCDEVQLGPIVSLRRGYAGDPRRTLNRQAGPIRRPGVARFGEIRHLCRRMQRLSPQGDMGDLIY